MQDNPNIKYRPSLIEENPTLLIWLLLLVAYLLVAMIAKYAWFIRDEQIVEGTLWLLLCRGGVHRRSSRSLARRRSENNPGRTSCRPYRRAASGTCREGLDAENAVVLGYDVHGKPWKWTDETRVMQALVLGQTGSGKTTLLRNIITPGPDASCRTARRIGTRFRW